MGQFSPKWQVCHNLLSLRSPLRELWWEKIRGEWKKIQGGRKKYFSNVLRSLAKLLRSLAKLLVLSQKIFGVPSQNLIKKNIYEREAKVLRGNANIFARERKKFCERRTNIWKIFFPPTLNFFHSLWFFPTTMSFKGSVESHVMPNLFSFSAGHKILSNMSCCSFHTLNNYIPHNTHTHTQHTQHTPPHTHTHTPHTTHTHTHHTHTHTHTTHLDGLSGF